MTLLKYVVQKKESINKTFSVPGDKSMSHRAVMFAAIAKGTTEIEGYLMGEDCLATITCFREMGVHIDIDESRVIVHGKGMYGLEKPSKILDVCNSGTLIRLISGILVAQNFECDITGDGSIQKRPMRRIIDPLRQMGANIFGKDGNLAPLNIKGSSLNGIEYHQSVPSAQVKSAILLASLYAKGETVIYEPVSSRDHTEIMLNYLGANIKQYTGKIVSNPISELHAKKIAISGDISSAAYFLVAGLICKNSRIVITNVGINVTRTGIITALQSMGGNINIMNKREVCGEWVADLEVSTSELIATEISGSIIPRMIDEIPIFAIAALFAKGTTRIKDAAELKVKESDRIHSIVTELKKAGACIIEHDDGMSIEGGHTLHGAEMESYGDHRIAMSLAILGLVVDGICINNPSCADVSFPEFFKYIEEI